MTEHIQTTRFNPNLEINTAKPQRISSLVELFEYCSAKGAGLSISVNPNVPGALFRILFGTKASSFSISEKDISSDEAILFLELNRWIERIEMEGFFDE